jgi:diguanylate cyclase (GGDEF)-like protein
MLAQTNSRYLRNLVCIAIAVVAAATLAKLVALWSLRADAVDEASREIGNIATILADQTSQSVKAFDEALLALQQPLVAMEEAAPEGFDDTIRSKAVHDLLASQLARVPQADTMGIIGATGHLVSLARIWPVPDTDVSDRESFLVHKKRPNPDIYVSAPVLTKLSKETHLFFSRRLESKRGEFLGVVQVSVRIDHFQRLYKSLRALGDLSILFLRSDGTVLMRYPNGGDHSISKMPEGSPWYAVAAAGGGFFEALRIFAKGERLVVARRISGYPLVVDVTESMATALAPWQHRATQIGIAIVLSVICFALLLRALVVQLRRFAASQASLADRESRLSEKSRELAGANTQLDAALNNMSQGLSMFDKDGRLVICNVRYRRMYGLPPEMVRAGVSLVDMLACRRRHGNFDDDPETFVAVLLTRLADGERCHSCSRLADGRIISVNSEPMAGGGWVATHEDITERQRSEERIARMARHDALTELANRVLFRERMDDALKRHTNDGTAFAILLFDLDLFKAVNDSLGHPVGDALLKAVAKRLTGAISPNDTVGRLGGDEFAILQLAQSSQRDNAMVLATRLLELVGAPYEIDGHRIVIGISIGIAVAPYDGFDSAQLLKNADLALYRAKADGRNTFRFFEQEMDEDLRRRRALEIDLQNALTNHELAAYYQPIVDIGSGETCTIEALVRWHHPVHGLTPPDSFIPIAEERGMITAIGRWMMREACRDAASWPKHIRVAVNLSPVQFRSGDLYDTVVGALADSGLTPERLELEITESVLLQKNDRDLAVLRRIQRLGVAIVLDDFGTGYSSLGYLRLFPFDKIKIEKSFVQEMPSRPDCAAIVCAITSLGRELGMLAVAEGVETREQLELVRAAGCKLAQGFLFSPPRPASELRFAERDGAAAFAAAG